MIAVGLNTWPQKTNPKSGGIGIRPMRINNFFSDYRVALLFFDWWGQLVNNTVKYSAACLDIRVSFNPSHMIGLHRKKESLWPKWDLKFKYHATDFVLMHDLCWLQLSKDQWCVLTYCASTQRRQSRKDYWDCSVFILITCLCLPKKAWMTSFVTLEAYLVQINLRRL